LRHHLDQVGIVAAQPLQDIDIHDAVGLGQCAASVRSHQRLDRAEHRACMAELGQRRAQLQIGLRQLRDLAPEHGQQRGALSGLQHRRQFDGRGPEVGSQLFGGLRKALLEILQQLDHAVRIHARYLAGRRRGSSALMWRRIWAGLRSQLTCSRSKS
jgi:hypothetical protein